MIYVECPSCKRAYQVQDAALGSRVKCPDCGATFLVKGGAPGPSEQADTSQQSAPPQSDRASAPDQLAGVAGARPKPLPADKPGGLQPAFLAAARKRPFALVLLVFYWAFTGALAVFGGQLSMAYGVVGGVIGSAIGDSGFSGLPQAELVVRGFGLAMALVEFSGLLQFCYGFLLLAACYGLWTFHKWGVVLGRRLAIAGAALSGISLIFILYFRAGIVFGIAYLVINIAILVYLYGGADFTARLRQQLRPGTPRQDMWEGYE